MSQYPLLLLTAILNKKPPLAHRWPNLGSLSFGWQAFTGPALAWVIRPLIGIYFMGNYSFQLKKLYILSDTYILQLVDQGSSSGGYTSTPINRVLIEYHIFLLYMFYGLFTGETFTSVNFSV